MPASPGRVLPRDMNMRQWIEFLSGSGVQGEREPRSFPPTWSGFAADPVGELSYLDFGRIVFLFNDIGTELVGTSNTNQMQFSGLPASIRPSSARWVHCLVTNNDFVTSGAVIVGSDGVVQFYADDIVNIWGAIDSPTPNIANFNNANTKGVPGGWLITYVK